MLILDLFFNCLVFSVRMFVVVVVVVLVRCGVANNTSRVRRTSSFSPVPPFQPCGEKRSWGFVQLKTF